MKKQFRNLELEHNERMGTDMRNGTRRGKGKVGENWDRGRRCERKERKVNKNEDQGVKGKKRAAERRGQQTGKHVAPLFRRHGVL